MTRIVLYRCQNSGGPGKIIDIPEVREIVLSCGGQLEVIHILKAFEDGKDGVCIVHCPPGECRTRGGSATAIRRINHTRRLLEEIPVDPRRLRSVCFTKECDLKKELLDFMETLKNIH